jgi:ParB family transcriptional regulator, chromosome partitioning protein
MAKQRRLGRGLDALIGPGPAAVPDAADPATPPSQAAPADLTSGGGTLAAQIPAGTPGEAIELPLDHIAPNPYQPRQDFDEEGLAELTRSVASSGIIQPLVVRPRPDGRYELVAGERRLRAALALDLKTAPAVIRQVPDERMLEMALIENIQRRDLNPIEKAEAFRSFIAQYRLTQQQAAERVGLDRATLANHLRLLDLPEDIQRLVRRQALSMSHARTIAAVADPTIQLDLAKKVIRQGLSVRQLERTVGKLSQPSQPTAAATVRHTSPEAAALEDQLREAFGTKVRIEEGRKTGTGRIIVEYYSFDDVDRILRVLRR